MTTSIANNDKTSGMTARQRTGRSALGVIRQLRAHQWTKNLLVFVPFAAAHLRNVERLADVAVSFLSLCLAASAGYAINDLRDRRADSLHPRKQSRPVASGQLSTVSAGFLAAFLITAAAALAAVAGRSAAVLILGYFVFSLLYTFVVKTIAIVDVLALSGLYAVRLYIGAAAARVPISEWLLTFAAFFFLSLALVKRYAEVDAAERGGTGIAGRAYRAGDSGILKSAGVAAAYVSVLVFTLYLKSEQVRKLYSRPGLLWLVCPLLLYWLTRMWFLAQRGEMHDDPIVAAITDAVSWVVAALLIIIMLAAI